MCAWLFGFVVRLGASLIAVSFIYKVDVIAEDR